MRRVYTTVDVTCTSRNLENYSGVAATNLGPHNEPNLDKRGLGIVRVSPRRHPYDWGSAPASTGAQVALFLWLKVGWGYESDGSESYAPQIMTHVRLHALSCRQGCFCESVNGFKTVMEIDTIVPGKACAKL